MLHSASFLGFTHEGHQTELNQSLLHNEKWAKFANAR